MFSIHKGDKPRHFLKTIGDLFHFLFSNLSCYICLYYVSRSIAGRIKYKLQKIINTDQTGFVSGRFIGKNTRLIHLYAHAFFVSSSLYLNYPLYLSSCFVCFCFCNAMLQFKIETNQICASLCETSRIYVKMLYFLDLLQI